MTSVTIDPSTGNQVHLTEHQMLVTAFDDAMYMGLMVYVYDATGINRYFLSLPSIMARDSAWMQALRYGVMFASMLELRRWLTVMGVPTDASTFLSHILSSVQRFGTST